MGYGCGICVVYFLGKQLVANHIIVNFVSFEKCLRNKTYGKDTED